VSSFPFTSFLPPGKAPILIGPNLQLPLRTPWPSEDRRQTCIIRIGLRLGGTLVKERVLLGGRWLWLELWAWRIMKAGMRRCTRRDLRVTRVLVLRWHLGFFTFHFLMTSPNSQPSSRSPPSFNDSRVYPTSSSQRLEHHDWPTQRSLLLRSRGFS